ncbi:hypothetical protein AVEN_55450-1 [Araneus ventricosus]|uniref:Uncharacterized protein n=1 Tax=Araneus ventricosus TaxID=182803 RepID=A0A4Y2MRE8_ARAVE|nr:hypothetical protein AVEN_55450-1 [Araneus ventricosus]
MEIEKDEFFNQLSLRFITEYRDFFPQTSRNHWPRGLVVKFWLGAGMFQVRKLIPPKIRRVCGFGDFKGQTSSHWCRAEVWRGEACRFLCRPRHLTTAQNYEIRPNIAFEIEVWE